jgi:thiol:disulfide interchange protein
VSSPPQPALPRPAPWQFTLRGMLGLMFVSGVIAAAWKIAPQAVVLALGILAAVISSRRLAGEAWNRGRVRVGPFGFAIVAWSGLYAVSVGPAVGLLQRLPLNREPIERFYAPLVWLHDNSRLAGPLEWYLDFWR